MGFRFRRSLRIAPGIRLNFTRSGLSATLGRRGASISVGSRGTRGHLGIPRTGLSYSERLTAGSASAPSSRAQTFGGGCALVAVIGFLVLLVGMCSTPKTNNSANSGALSAPIATDTAYVSATSVNCRSGPSTSSKVLAGLQKGDAAIILERSGTWTKVQGAAAACWISSALLSSQPIAPAESFPSAPQQEVSFAEPTITVKAGIVPTGATFECTPVRVWDGDGPVWCAEGPKVRIAGIAAREADGSCRPNHPCPPASAAAAKQALVSLLGGARGTAPQGHALVRGPRLTCASEGSARGSRTAAWCASPTTGDLSCAMVRTGTVLKWQRYWRNHRC